MEQLKLKIEENTQKKNKLAEDISLLEKKNNELTDQIKSMEDKSRNLKEENKKIASECAAKIEKINQLIEEKKIVNLEKISEDSLSEEIKEKIAIIKEYEKKKKEEELKKKREEEKEELEREVGFISKFDFY